MMSNPLLQRPVLSTMAATVCRSSALRAPATRGMATINDSMPLSKPTGYDGNAGKFDVYTLPPTVTNCPSDIYLGQAIVKSIRRDGLIQITTNQLQQEITRRAFDSSKSFFALPQAVKAACLDSNSFSGYIASGEEITDGIRDYSEAFTVCKDLPLEDYRVKAQWPCHGPCPWPSAAMKATMLDYMSHLGESGEKLLRLVALGLGVDPEALVRYTRDGWNHLRVLRYPERHNTNGSGKEGRGVGSHTDYGLLVLSAQDQVGGLFVQPPSKENTVANWEGSTAGLNEDDEGWVYVPPRTDVLSVFPGDMLQYLTSSHLTATQHKVGLNTAERFAFAYFHEPNFSAVLRPLKHLSPLSTFSTRLSRATDMSAQPLMQHNGLHYGTHFTNMFMRNYPDRVTTVRMKAENRMAKLETSDLRWGGQGVPGAGMLGDDDQAGKYGGVLVDGPGTMR